MTALPLRAVCAAGICVASLAQVHAQPEDSAPADADADAGVVVSESEAVRLTREGTRAWERGDHATALEYFELADRVQPSPKFHYNRGLALAGLARYSEALAAFEAFLRDAPDAPADARSYAASQVRALEAKVATVEITGVPTTAVVTIDGERVLPRRPARLDVGRHNVMAAVPGFAPRMQDFVLVAGQRLVVELKLEPLAPRAAPPTEPMAALSPHAARHERPRKQRGSVLKSPWFWGAVGVVAGGLTVWALSGDDGVSCPSSDLGCVR